jgi:hypothetical protein
MPFASYATLTTALSTWRRRTFTSSDTDEFIALAEFEANQLLGPTYRRETTATVNTDASGIGVLPTGFDGLISITRNVLGSLPLKQVSWEALVTRNPSQVASDASSFALRGTSFQVAEVTDDDFVLVYRAQLTPLSGSNTTNWLLTQLPNYYLFMGQSYAALRFETTDVAQGLRGLALNLLEHLVDNDVVAQFGNSELTLDCAP